MKVATNIILLLVILGSCVEPLPENYNVKPPSMMVGNPEPEIVEIVLPPRDGYPNGVTVDVERNLAIRYSDISVFEGITPPPSTDFDIIPLHIKGSARDSIYLICIK